MSPSREGGCAGRGLVWAGPPLLPFLPRLPRCRLPSCGRHSFHLPLKAAPSFPFPRVPTRGPARTSRVPAVRHLAVRGKALFPDAHGRRQASRSSSPLSRDRTCCCRLGMHREGRHSRSPHLIMLLSSSLPSASLSHRCANRPEGVRSPPRVGATSQTPSDIGLHPSPANQDVGPWVARGEGRPPPRSPRSCNHPSHLDTGPVRRRR
ncbi:hypothetical protein B0T11DRAFT_24205 [Plectosphaerella cucumerina]|uniref:Uncharacterized protein n=1 Tax=Plectosphaerella cucumerina TaxID=40658 RepID=A0A8K0X9F1_9PEZI|nr:hypothetical protein B0T11DRAFT_24205 [Plectosphaerella cucumerina]